MLMGSPRDLRMMTIYSYTRLVVFDDKLNLVPDILQSVDSQEDKVFTLHLRPGHKWSDGQPFTAEDFRYYWEDVANNKVLSPGGPNAALFVAGKPPRFEVIDPETVRFSWDAPNPGFLPALAGAQPLFIFMPSHYLKQFHIRYADKTALEAAVRDAHVKDWASLHERKSRQYRPENPDLPTLDPWHNTTAPPAQLFVFERNPFFHRIDEDGRQLPYFDRVTLQLGTTTLIPAKTATGEADLQGRYLAFEDYTFLRHAEGPNHYHVALWQMGGGSRAALMPNLNTTDRVWRRVLRDVRVRRALSLGINRHDLNRVLFFGLARESGNTVLPESPLYRPEYAKAFAGYDVKTANRLLNEAGLEKRDRSGYRLLPDGRRADIIVETSGNDNLGSDLMELVADDWRRLGVRAFIHTSSPDAFRRRLLSGNAIMSLGPGLDDGVPTSDIEPSELAPVSDAQFEWPLWGLYTLTNGHEGEPVDMASARQLLELEHQWGRSTSSAERTTIWHSMLSLFADQVFTIGLVNGTQQPVVISNKLRNVPDKAIWSFLPGAYFGITMPDTFWFDAPKARAQH